MAWLDAHDTLSSFMEGGRPNRELFSLVRGRCPDGRELRVPGIDPKILDPRDTWPDPQAYDRQARKLAQMFVDNFAEFESGVSEQIRAAAPRPDAIVGG